MLIHTYGLFWQIDQVHWGWQKERGNLLGQKYGERKRIADFRDQTGIYALYADYDLIYVGQTGAKVSQKLFGRLKQHRRDMSGRWNRFSWFGTKRVRTSKSKSEKYFGLSKGKQNPTAKLSEALNHLEAILIDVAEPKLNRQGGKWEKAIEYKQYRDKARLGIPESEMIKNIYGQLNDSKE